MRAQVIRLSVVFLIAMLFVRDVRASYIPPAGFGRTPDTFNGDAFAVAPDGKVAVGLSNGAGGATIRVYANANDAHLGGTPIRTFTDPTYKFWGDFTFADNDTLLFSED